MAGLVGGSASGQIVLALSMLGAARIFAPADLGALGVTTSIATVVGIALAGRLELALTVERDDAVFARLARSLRRWGDSIAAVATVWAIVLLLSGAVAMWPLKQIAIWAVVPLAAALTFTSNTESFAATRQQAYRDLSAGTFSLGAAQGVALIAAGLIHASALTAALSYVVGRLVATRLLRGRLEISDTEAGAPALRQIIRTRREYLYLITPGQVLTNLTTGVPTLFIANSFGLAEAGIYFLVSRMIRLPVRTVSTAISRVLFGEISAEADERKALPVIRPFLFLASALGLFALAASYLVSQLDLGSFLGASWAPASEFIVPTTLSAVFQLASSPLAFSLLRLEKHYAMLAVQIARFSLIMMPPLVHVWVDLSLQQAVWWVNVALAVSYVVNGVVSYRSLREFS